ncbi:MAG: hypothetical protein ACI8TQ_002729 [Planctomycetota bacterium]|jgi:hypothetical protein
MSSKLDDVLKSMPLAVLLVQSPRCLAAIALVFISVSCGSEFPEAVPVEKQTATEPTVALTDADLSALGYVDFAEPAEDELESGVVHFDRNLSAPGYSLYVSIPMATAVLIDAEGREVHRWQSNDAKRWVRCELLPDGDVLILGTLKKASGPDLSDGFIMRLSWTGTERWTRSLPFHHDLDWDPDGMILALTQERRELPDNSNWPAVLDNRVQRIDVNGELLESHSLTEVLNLKDSLIDLGIEASLESMPEEDAQVFEDVFAELEAWRATQPTETANVDAKTATKDKPSPIAEQQSNPSDYPLDLIHANTVNWISLMDPNSPLFGANVLVTMRHLDVVAAFDWATGQERWRSTEGLLQGPHEANLLTNGNLMIFDNGIRGRGFTRIIELDPRTMSIAWQWQADEPTDFYCRTRGTCQSLENGNVLIADSEKGAAFEVTRSGEIVWRFFSPIVDSEGRRGAIRILRYETEFIDKLLQSHN